MRPEERLTLHDALIYEDKKVSEEQAANILSSMEPMHLLFCKEYLKDLNGKAARARAGYLDTANSHQMAFKLLSKANTQLALSYFMRKRARKITIDADYILGGLKTVVERCLQQAPVMIYDYNEKQLVQKTDEEGNGVWEFNSAGANKALELLGKHIGMFNSKTPGGDEGKTLAQLLTNKKNLAPVKQADEEAPKNRVTDGIITVSEEKEK